MKKKVDIDTDTIQSVRERNNKRYAFHQSLAYLSKGLLRMAGKKEEASTAKSTFEQKDASRFNPDNANKRYKVKHSILGVVGETGVTPFVGDPDEKNARCKMASTTQPSGWDPSLGCL